MHFSQIVLLNIPLDFVEPNISAPLVIWVVDENLQRIPDETFQIRMKFCPDQNS